MRSMLRWTLAALLCAMTIVSVSAQSVSPRVASILQRQGNIPIDFFQGTTAIGPDSYDDRLAILRSCEPSLTELFSTIEQQFGSDQAVKRLSTMLASSVHLLRLARAGGPNSGDLRIIEERYRQGKAIGVRSMEGDTYSCLLARALQLVDGNGAKSGPLRDFSAADIAEYRSRCRQERRDNYERTGPALLGEPFNPANIDRYDEVKMAGLQGYTSISGNAASFLDVFYHWRKIDLPELERLSKPEANFGRGWGSLGKHMVCAGQVRVEQLKRRGGASSQAHSAASPQLGPTSATAQRPQTATTNVARPGMAPRPAPRRINGVKDPYGGVESDLGPLGMAAAAQALAPGPAPSPEQVTAQRRAASTAAERAAFQKVKSRIVHNRANDATACLKVEPTGVISEWGIEGRFRLINSCSHPVEASWCANTAECSSARGSTWTIRAGGNYPIFFADATNPNIQVGACKAGEAKQPPLGEQPGINRTGFSEAREMPQPATGVSLMPGHRCE